MRFAAEKCEKLGIDDPIAWFNACPTDVLDFWVALELVRRDEADEARDGKMMSPADALKKLRNTHG